MMRKLLINLVLISSAGLAGCSTENRIAMPELDLPDWSVPGIYRIPIQQGNLITQQMVNELKPGMTKQQVRFLLGTPLLVDTFHADRWDYLYTNRPGSVSLHVDTEKQRLELHFENDRLRKIVGDIHPQAEDMAKVTKEESRERTLVIPADAPRNLEDNGFIEGLWNKVRGKDDEPVIQNKAPETQASETTENTD